MKIIHGWESRMAVAMFFAVTAGTALAQHNYQNYLVGDRASGMGGAVVAGADKVDACYYNPAGLVRSDANTFSLSGSLYGWQTYKAKNGLFPGEDVTYDSFVTIPTTVGGVWKTSDRYALGFAVFIPYRSTYNEMKAYQNNQHVYNYNMDDQTLWAGPSAAWQITPQLSIGASIYGVYRSYNEYISLIYEEVNTGYADGRKFTDWSALAGIGLQYQALEKLRLGLYFQSPSVHIWGDGSYQLELVTRETTENIYETGMDTDNQEPAKITAGIAWSEPRVYALELNVTYHFSQAFDLHSGSDKENDLMTWRVDRDSVFNFNIGAEYYIRKIYPVRAGFFTDFSAAAGVSPKDRDNVPRMDGYGFSASIGKEVGHMAVNIGLIYVFGDGRSLGWYSGDDEFNLQTTDAHSSNIYGMINTAYKF